MSRPRLSPYSSRKATPTEARPTGKEIARLLFLRKCAELRVPELALLFAIDHFGELPRDINEPFVLQTCGEWDLPTWNYRYQSEAEFRRAVHAGVDRHLDFEIDVWKTVLADERFEEIRPHQQSRTLEKQLTFLAENWLLARIPKDPIAQLATAGYKEPESSFWKALNGASAACHRRCNNPQSAG